MEQVELKLESRTQTGKGPNRRLRSQGKVPAVLYGMGELKNVSADPKTLERTLLSEGGKNAIFSLHGAELDGRHALVKDYQVDPVLRHLLHVDLMEIDIQKKVDVTVPINLIGKPVGVVEGGVLNVIDREIEIICIPAQIPRHIDIDVSALKIGDSIHAADVKLPEGVERPATSNPTLVTVVPPAKEEDLQASLSAEGEPEVIGEKKEDKDKKAEGASDAKDKDKK